SGLQGSHPLRHFQTGRNAPQGSKHFTPERARMETPNRPGDGGTLHVRLVSQLAGTVAPLSCAARNVSAGCGRPQPAKMSGALGRRQIRPPTGVLLVTKPSAQPAMQVPLLDLKPQYKPLAAEILTAIEKVCASQAFILGPAVKELEAVVAAYSQCRLGLGVSSGTDALLLALMAL